MNGPQSGNFALGNPSHAYLEFDLQQDRDSSELVTALADVREPGTTIGGVNLVSGFRPVLRRALAPHGLPDDLVGFDADLVRADDLGMPGAQHQVVLQLPAGSSDG